MKGSKTMVEQLRRKPIFGVEDSDPDMLNQLRKEYPQGRKVYLVEKMDDPESPPAGTKGTVMFVDDLGTIFVEWENGIQLGVVYEWDLISFL